MQRSHTWMCAQKCSVLRAVAIPAANQSGTATPRGGRREQCCWRLSPYQPGRRGARRGSRGFASFTGMARPASCEPCSPSMAALADRLSGISTKPKPRERPVSRSVMILTFSTAPYCSKSWRRSFSVAVNARLPTKMFTQGSFWVSVATIARVSEQYAGAIQGSYGEA